MTISKENLLSTTILLENKLIAIFECRKQLIFSERIKFIRMGQYIYRRYVFVGFI